MNMKFFIFSFLLISSQAFAANCKYSFQSETSKLNWTAFKTPQKVGVKGGFTEFKIKSKTSDSILNVIKSATFTVNTASVSTGDKARDAKIAKFFFNADKAKVGIAGKVNSITSGVAQVEYTINKTKKIVPMTIVVKDDLATLSGKIDVLDFMLNDQLTALNTACSQLHQGKTWSDVEISLEASFKKVCR